MINEKELQKEINVLTNEKKTKLNYEKIRKMLESKKINYVDVTGEYDVNSKFDLKIEFENEFYIIYYSNFDRKYKVDKFIKISKEKYEKEVYASIKRIERLYTNGMCSKI